MHILMTGAAGMIGRKLTARLVKDGALKLNMDDEITRSTLVTQAGEIVNPRVREFHKLPELAAASASPAAPANIARDGAVAKEAK